MDEILALQEELRKLQEQSSIHRLSERNCVELIMRLVKLGKLTVYFTQDGKEYVTPEQLESEIRDELMQHGGKVGVLNLPTLLNIDLNHIEARLAEMLKRDKRLQIMNGEVMTKYYLDGVAQEINEALAESGQIILTELAPRFSLTTDFVVQIVQERLGRTIKGQLEQGVLYTHLFIDRCKAQMRAAFSAITRPTPISQIVSTYSFNERLFYASLDEIKNEPRFAGVIDRGTYVPHIYSYTRKKWIESFLSQNGFIEYNKLSKINIPEPRKYLLVNFPEGLPLETCFVASSVIQQVDASVSDALANNAWLDVMPLVEFQLSAKDAMVLLKSCPSFIAASQEKKESPVILDDHYLVSRGLLERCVASLKDKVATETPKKAPLIIQALGKHIPASKPAAAEEEEETKGKGRGGKGGKGGKAGGGGGGGGGKGGRGGNQKGKRRGKGRDDDEDEEEEEEKVVERPSARGRNAAAAATASAKSRAAGGVQQEVLTEAEVRACLKQWYDEAEADFLDVLYQQIRPIVRELNKAAVEGIQQNASSGKKKDHKALEQQFSVLYQNIQLFLRSAEEVTDSAVSEALRRHLLATLCTEATNLLVYMMALHHGVSMEAEKITTANERKEVIAQLPLTAATPLTALGDSLRGSGVEEFLKQLESLSEEAQLHLKPLDKKKQRLLTHTHKLDFLEQLKEATEPPLAFHLAAVVLYAQVFNLALHIPGRSVPALLAQMADHLPADLVAELTQLSELLKKGEAIEAERVEGLKAKVVEFASAKKEREK